MVDNGIGHYEFWGSPGYDSRIEPELDEITLDEYSFWDEDGNEITEQIEDPEKILQEWINENTGDIESRFYEEDISEY